MTLGWFLDRSAGSFKEVPKSHRTNQVTTTKSSHDTKHCNNIAEKTNVFRYTCVGNSNPNTFWSVVRIWASSSRSSSERVQTYLCRQLKPEHFFISSADIGIFIEIIVSTVMHHRHN